MARYRIWDIAERGKIVRRVGAKPGSRDSVALGMSIFRVVCKVVFLHHVVYGVVVRTDLVRRTCNSPAVVDSGV